MRWEDGGVVEVNLFDGEELYKWLSLGPIPVFTGFMHPQMRTMHTLACPQNRVEVKSGLSNGRWKTSKDIWIEALRRGLADSSDGATGDIADLIGRAFIPPERYDEALEQGVVSDGVLAVCVQVIGTRGAQRADHTIGLMASLRDARAAIPWGTHMVYATCGLRTNRT